MGSEIPIDNLYLADAHSLVDSIQRDVKNLNLSFELFTKAKNNNDKLAMRASLLHIRGFMMGLSDIFYQTSEVIELFFKYSGDISFPDDYKVPEHYNYPIK